MNAWKLPLVVAMAMLAWAWPAVAQETPETADPATTIHQIAVQGNARLSEQAILSYVRSRPGETYDEKLVQADQRRLLESRKFDNVRTEIAHSPEGIVITFFVVERPAIKELTFSGNRKFKEKELRKDIAFGEGDAVDPFSIESARQAIINKYHEKGFYRVDVSYDADALQKKQALNYVIIEGPQVKIRKLRFEGKQSFSAWTLRSKIESSARFWPFIQGYYDPEMVGRDVTALRNFYMSEGYLDAEVTRSLEFMNNEKGLILTFVIKEGPRFRINELKFDGNMVFDNQSLEQNLLLQRGEYYTALKLQRDLEKLQGKYGEIGYIQADVDARKEFLPPDAPTPSWAQRLEDGKPALLNIIFRLVENDQYHVGRVDIRGNRVTQSRVIRREVRVVPEQLYNTVAVEESKKRLMEQRIFEKVTMTPVGNEPGSRDLLVQVEEGKTAEFLIGVGVSSDSGLLGNISFTQRNFDHAAWPSSWEDIAKGTAWKGAGETFRISAEPGTELMRFTTEWFNPSLWDGPYSGGLKGYLFERGRETYDEGRIGALGSVGRRFPNRWYGELSPKIEGVDISSLDHDAPPEVVDDEGNSMLASLKGTLVRDRTDSRWLPSTGDRIRVSYEQTGGSFDFGRAIGEYQIFRTMYVDALDRKHILAGRAMLGQIFGDAPVFEEFYGGGSSSIRGFKYRGISPRSEGFDPVAPSTHRVGAGEPIGGDFMFFLGSEYSFPLIGEQLRGVFFVDSGTVEPDFSLSDYRVSTGFGIRWIVPLLGPVPLSLDFGFPVLKQPQDDTQIFSFSFGWTF